METGIVKLWNEDRGFGFIEMVGGDGDVFVHVSALRGAGLDHLITGQRLSFEIEIDRRTGKPRALDVRPA